MGKWADYLISGVRYDQDHRCISELKVHEYKDDKVSVASIWTRSQVVRSINCDHHFITIYKKEGLWTKGEDVRVIEIEGKKYLRTDSNKIKKDNLGELPEF